MRRVSLQWRENQMSGGEKFRHWIKIRTSQLARDYSPIIITWRDSYFSKWSWDSPIVHQWLTGRQIHSLYPYSPCSAICGVFLATQSCRAPAVFWEKLYKAARKKSWKWAPSEFKGVTLTAEFNVKCKFLNTLISAAQTKNSLHFTIRRLVVRFGMLIIWQHALGVRLRETGGASRGSVWTFTKTAWHVSSGRNQLLPPLRELYCKVASDFTLASLLTPIL